MRSGELADVLEHELRAQLGESESLTLWSYFREAPGAPTAADVASAAFVVVGGLLSGTVASPSMLYYAMGLTDGRLVVTRVEAVLGSASTREPFRGRATGVASYDLTALPALQRVQRLGAEAVTVHDPVEPYTMLIPVESAPEAPSARQLLRAIVDLGASGPSA